MIALLEITGGMTLTMQQLFGSVIPMLANLAILIYVCQRLLALTRSRREIMKEMREFASIVRRARDNLCYIGEQVHRGMEEIKEDIGNELRITDCLTTQSAKLAGVVQKFAILEENVIELVRMERNRENVRIETPADVNEEVKRILAAAEKRKGREEQDGERGNGTTDEHGKTSSIRDYATRNPLSKFSAYGPRELGSSTRKSTDDNKSRTRPEVRLLGETIRRAPKQAP